MAIPARTADGRSIISKSPYPTVWRITMSSAAITASPGSRTGAALTALIPPLAGAAVAYALRHADAGEFQEVAAAATTIIVGIPFMQSAVRRDEERSVQTDEARSPAGTQTVGIPTSAVVPGATTVAMAVV